MAIIDRVKFDGPADVLVWRYPPDDLSWGTQVIVNQAQEAVFFKGGQALDVLGPGTHTLRTANLPVLRSLIKIPFGDQTPFAAEVYFVNKAVHMDVKWGTSSPMPILDPKYNIFLPVRAFGQFAIRVSDSRQFAVQLSGTLPQFTVDALNAYFRGIVLTKAKDLIAETILHEKINLLEISAHLDEISTALQAKMSGDFSRFGVELVNFMLNSVDVPEDDDTVVRLKKALAEKAEIDILGDSYRMKRTFDTAEKAAANPGGGAGAGVGLGLGLGTGTVMGGMMAAVMGESASTAPAHTAACPACKAQVPASAKFCPECGGAMVAATSKCPACSADVAAGAKFCSSCGKRLASKLCPGCSAEVAPTAKFCPSCGKPVP